jgi:hypothetical protein
MNSNYTLKFPRTSREAFGHNAQFHDSESWGRRIFIAALIGVAFVIGLMFGCLV